MIRINLLPVRVSKRKEAGRQQVALLAAVLLLGLLANWGWSHSRAGELERRRARIARTRTEIANLERIIGEVRDIKAAQAELQQKLEVLRKLQAGRSGPVRMLDALATITPRQLWLTKLEEKGGAIAFTGTAVTIDDVSAFMAALKTSPYFSRVELKKTAAAVAKTGERLVDFEIDAADHYVPEPPAGGAAPGAPARPAGARG